MKLTDIQVGGRYTAKVSGVITTVRVLAIREDYSWHLAKRRAATRIDAVNEATGRRLTFKSAARLRRAVVTTPPAAAPAPAPAVEGA